MIEVSTSILTIKKGKELETILALEKAKTDYFHIDVMDGKFVVNDTYELMQENISQIKKVSSLPLDVHLMVDDVKKGIEDFSVYDPNIITFHYEACENKEQVFEYINLIKKYNSKIGLSVKPNTNIEEIYEFIPYIHMVLVMTVEPGLGGQELIPETLEKIEALKKYVDKYNYEIDIEADGGINLDTVEEIKKVGTNIIVAGSSILNSEDYSIMIKELKK